MSVRTLSRKAEPLPLRSDDLLGTIFSVASLLGKNFGGAVEVTGNIKGQTIPRVVIEPAAWKMDLFDVADEITRAVSEATHTRRDSVTIRFQFLDSEDEETGSRLVVCAVEAHNDNFASSQYLLFTGAQAGKPGNLVYP